MTPEFNRWWDADALTQTNPYEPDTPVYWSWEGWQAAVRSMREQKPVFLWHKVSDPNECEVFDVNEHNLSCSDCVPLFAAPVPSKLPAPLPLDGKYGKDHMYADGWNDCIEQMKNQHDDTDVVDCDQGVDKDDEALLRECLDTFCAINLCSVNSMSSRQEMVRLANVAIVTLRERLGDAT